MRAALEIALSGGHEFRAGNAFVNMYWMYCDELRHEEAEQIYHEALAYCDEHDIGTSADCLLAERAGVFEKLGRWDECLSIAHATLDDQSLSPANRYAAAVLPGEGDGAPRTRRIWPYLDEAMRLCTRFRGAGLADLCAPGTDRGVLARGPSRCGSEPSWIAVARCLGQALLPVAARLDRPVDPAPYRDHDPIDLEPFASQLSGNGARAVELWDRLGSAMKPR